MNNMNSNRLLKAVLLCLIATTPAIAADYEYTGRVYAERAATLLPLGSGNGVMTIEAAGIVAMSGNPPSVFTLACAGLGVVDAEGKADTEAYCRLDETPSDSIDLKGSVKQGQGKFEVIGGSGKYAGATGTATYRRLDNTGETDADEAGTGVIELKFRTK